MHDDRLTPVEPTPLETRRKAVLAVLRTAESAKDAAALLHALGLWDTAKDMWSGER